MMGALDRILGFTRMIGGGLLEAVTAQRVRWGSGFTVEVDPETEEATITATAATGPGVAGLSISYAGTVVATGVNQLRATQQQAAQIYPADGHAGACTIYVPILPQVRRSFRVEIALDASPVIDGITSDVGTSNESTVSTLTTSNVTCSRTATGVYQLLWPIDALGEITTMPMISACSTVFMVAQIANWGADGSGHRVVTFHTRDQTGALANVGGSAVLWVFG
jgi:hypothetical protein